RRVGDAPLRAGDARPARPRDHRLYERQARGGVRGRAALHGRADRPAGAQLPLGAGDGALKPVRRSRSRITAQARAKATAATSTAAPAPVTPKRSPSTTIRGSITAVSTPWAQSLSPGLPIVTGNVFVQLSTSWMAAATRIKRAAGTAGR